MKIHIPRDVLFILDRFSKNGFEAYTVGGCVRDSLLGRVPHDWDICTDSLPDNTKALFSDFKLIETGIKHGTVGVVINGSPYEITAYRVDGEYLDNRHPEAVTFTNNIDIDLSRRDFTVNAMAYNPEKGLADPYGGYDDLKSGTLRCVGNPEKRFGEDGLRIIRALRFASVYGFEPEENTSAAIRSLAPLLKGIAAERISAELLKLMCGNGAGEVFASYPEAFKVIIPQLGVLPSRGGCARTAGLISHTPCVPKLRMSALLLEACRTDKSASARRILQNLKLPKAFVSECADLIEYSGADLSTDSSLRHMLNRLGEKQTKRLIALQKADALTLGGSEGAQRAEKADEAFRRTEYLIASGACCFKKDLALNGSDILALGASDGKRVGAVLNRLLELVLDGKIENDFRALSEQAAVLLDESDDFLFGDCRKLN